MLPLIAWIGLLNSAVSIGACGVVVFAIHYAGLCELVKIAVGLSAGYYVLSIVAGLLFLKGLYDKQPMFALPVLGLQFIESIVHLSGYIFGIVLFVINDIAIWLLLFCPVGFILLAMFGYYWVHLFKHYRAELGNKRTGVNTYEKFE